MYPNIMVASIIFASWSHYSTDDSYGLIGSRDFWEAC